MGAPAPAAPASLAPMNIVKGLAKYIPICQSFICTSLSEDIWRLPTDYEYDHAASKRPWPERQNGLLLCYILSWWFDYAFPIISHLFA